MNNSRTCIALVCAVTLMMAASFTYGTVGALWLQPFHYEWAWEHPRLAGRVESYAILRANKDGSLQADSRVVHKLTYKDGHLTSEQIFSFGPSSPPDITIRYNADGQRSQIVAQFVTGGSSQPVIATETAAYDASGQLLSIGIARTDGKNSTVPVQTQTAADGSRTVSWKGLTSQDPESKLTYDKSGRLTEARRQWTQVGKESSSATWVKYNVNGDIQSLGDGPGSEPGTAFEYEYDTAGNWIKQTTYISMGTRMEKRHMEVLGRIGREIKYAQGSSGRPSTRPTTNGVAPGVVGGIYKAQVGDPSGSGFYSIMVLELHADHTLAYTNTMPDLANRGGRIENKAEGKWSLDGNTLTVQLLRSADNRPIPPQAKTMRFSMSQDAKVLKALPGNDPVFTREP